MGAGLWPALFQPNDVFPYRGGRRRAALRIPAVAGEQPVGAPPAPGGNRGMRRSPSRLPAARLAAARGASHEAMPPRARTCRANRAVSRLRVGCSNRRTRLHALLQRLSLRRAPLYDDCFHGRRSCGSAGRRAARHFPARRLHARGGRRNISCLRGGHGARAGNRAGRNFPCRARGGRGIPPAPPGAHARAQSASACGSGAGSGRGRILPHPGAAGAKWRRARGAQLSPILCARPIRHFPRPARHGLPGGSRGNRAIFPRCVCALRPPGQRARHRRARQLSRTRKRRRGNHRLPAIAIHKAIGSDREPGIFRQAAAHAGLGAAQPDRSVAPGHAALQWRRNLCGGRFFAPHRAQPWLIRSHNAFYRGRQALFGPAARRRKRRLDPPGERGSCGRGAPV